MISVIFLGHLGELSVSSATMATSFAGVTGYYFIVRLSRLFAWSLFVSRFVNPLLFPNFFYLAFCISCLLLPFLSKWWSLSLIYANGHIEWCCLSTYLCIISIWAIMSLRYFIIQAKKILTSLQTGMSLVGNGKCAWNFLWTGLWSQTISYAWYTFAKSYACSHGNMHSYSIHPELYRTYFHDLWTRHGNFLTSWDICPLG